MRRPIKAQKRPMVVECMQYTGDNLDALAAWIGEHNLDVEVVPGGVRMLWVEKAGSWIALKPGMWVMAESDGDGFYPCTEEAFKEGYEPVPETRTLKEFFTEGFKESRS